MNKIPADDIKFILRNVVDCPVKSRILSWLVSCAVESKEPEPIQDTDKQQTELKIYYKGERIAFRALLDGFHEFDCDLIIDDSDMPASFVWQMGDTVTEYGYKKFKELLDSDFTLLSNGNIQINCNNYIMGRDFVMASAGHIGHYEYDRIFKNINKG